LEKELSLRGIPFQHQVELPASYKGTFVGVYKADLIIDEKIVLEIKGISRLNASDEAQALHYLAATEMSPLEYRRVVKSETKGSR
jgi:GxxExxY protein